MAAPWSSRLFSRSRRCIGLGSLQNALGVQITWCRSLMLSKALRQEEEKEKEEVKGAPKRQVIDVETSMRYLDSKEFMEGYGDKPVWFHYRRNFKGQIIPPTRKTCIRQGEISTASPCPVCRDEYLVLDATNVKLLEHFICPYTGEIHNSMKTGLCQKQQRNLIVSVMKAWDQGLLEMKVPFRVYDYDDYKS